MSTILESLQSKWKYQDLGRVLVLATRRVLRPLVFWDVHYVFNRVLSSHAATAPADSDTTIHIFKSELDLAGAPADLTLLCPKAAERLRDGQVVVVAFANAVTAENAAGDNLTGMAAGAPKAPQTRIAGYTWITLSNIWLPEFDRTMIVRPGEMVHYDSFVSSPWRGQGLHTILILVAKRYALSAGCTHSLSWISVFNSQSLKTAQRLVRKPDRPMMVLSVKLRGMKRFRTVALQGRLGTRFKGY